MKFFNLFFLAILISSCSGNNELKNSKKLIKQGHSSLYNNGAFQLPYSSVKLIPPGEEVFTLSSQLAVIKAKESWKIALEKAQEGFFIIKKGTLKSYQASKAGAKKWGEVVNQINKHSRKNSIWLIKRSYAKGLGITQKGYAKSIKMKKKMILYGDELPRKSFLASKKLGDFIQERIKELENENKKALEKINENRTSGATFRKGKEGFVKGYLALSDNLEASYTKMKIKKIKKELQDERKQSTVVSDKMSNYSWGLIKSSFVDYFDNIQNSFSKAKKAMKEEDKYGITFSLFSSIGWLVDAGLWQGLVKPFGKIAGGAVGYLVSNGIIYPVLLATDGTVATGKILVEFVKFSGESFVHITAPSAKILLASIVSSSEAIYENSSYALIKAVKPITKGSLKTVEFVGQEALVAGGYTGKAFTKYVAVPVAVVGTNVITGASGVVVGTSGVMIGGSYGAAGEVLQGTSKIVQGGVVAAGTTVGTSASTVYASGVMAYHGLTAVVVPSSYILSSGVVLTYGMLTQLSAHTIMAMGDVSYVVLSLEGPKWILYGIKGKVDKDDHPQGTVIDLEKLQEKGEEIRRLELSEEEVNKLM